MANDQDNCKRCGGKKYRDYNFTLNTINISTNVPRVQNCNGFTATNIGADIAEVNGRVLMPSSAPATILGDSRSWGGNEGERYMGPIEVKFRTTVAALVEIEQKFYIDKD